MNLLLEYKEYFAIINYDNKDSIFIGKVVNTDDLLVFHGKTIDEIKEMFYQTIDNYLEICKKYDKQPILNNNS